MAARRGRALDGRESSSCARSATAGCPRRRSARLLGFDLVEVEPGHAVFEITPGEQHYNPIGVVHGGTCHDAARLGDGLRGADADAGGRRLHHARSEDQPGAADYLGNREAARDRQGRCTSASASRPPRAARGRRRASSTRTPPRHADSLDRDPEDGQRIAARFFRPQGEPQGSVLIVPAMGCDAGLLPAIRELAGKTGVQCRDLRLPRHRAVAAERSARLQGRHLRLGAARLRRDDRCAARGRSTGSATASAGRYCRSFRTANPSARRLLARELAPDPADGLVAVVRRDAARAVRCGATSRANRCARWATSRKA